MNGSPVISRTTRPPRLACLTTTLARAAWVSGWPSSPKPPSTSSGPSTDRRGLVLGDRGGLGRPSSVRTMRAVLGGLGDDHVGLPQQVGGAHGEQVGVAGAGADERHPASGPGSVAAVTPLVVVLPRVIWLSHLFCSSSGAGGCAAGAAVVGLLESWAWRQGSSGQAGRRGVPAPSSSISVASRAPTPARVVEGAGGRAAHRAGRRRWTAPRRAPTARRRPRPRRPRPARRSGPSSRPRAWPARRARR